MLGISPVQRSGGLNHGLHTPGHQGPQREGRRHRQGPSLHGGGAGGALSHFVVSSVLEGVDVPVGLLLHPGPDAHVGRLPSTSFTGISSF